MQLYKWFVNNQITFIVFSLGILFDIHFVSFKCEGKIIDPPAGNTIVTVKGSDVKIDWNFNDAKSSVNLRQWSFIGASGKRELLGQIVSLGIIDNRSSSLPRVEIQKPSTLKLYNVDRSYNGTYIFALSTVGTTESHVTLIIAEKPTVTINCSNPIDVDEGKDLTCLCKGEGGFPPANVTWYKDGVQIGDTRDEEKLLTLSNAKKTDSGTYKCVAQSYTLKEKKSIQVLLLFPPRETKLTFIPTLGECSKMVKILCEAEGYPPPTYEIRHENCILGIGKTYIMKVDEFHVGLYTCTAKNVLGTDSVGHNFTLSEKANSSQVDGGSVVVWHIVVTLVAGFITGILFSYMVVWSRRRFRKRKSCSKSEPQTPKDNSIYQDLDLNKMNSEDNYQSLRGNYAKNDAGPEQDPTYTELSKTRDGEDTYQTLS